MRSVRLLRTLFARREQRGSVVFGVAAVPLLGMALLRWGFFLPGVGLASICVFQALYPTLAGWTIVMAAFAGLISMILFAIVNDLSSTFATTSNAVYSIMFVLILLGIDAGLLIYRPRPLEVPE